jgi:putative tricarboxylic transport membrane protein
MALMVGAMIIQGIQPGPQVMTKNPDLFWGLIASMWIGNADADRPQPAADRHVGEAADVPYRFLFPAIMLFCCIGVYSPTTTPSTSMRSPIFGVFGYLLIKLGCRACAAAARLRARPA